MRARDGEAFNAYSRQSTVDCVLLLLLPLRVDVASWARRADAMMPWCKLQLIQSRKSRRKNNNLPVDRSRGQEFQIKSPRRAIRIYKFNFTADSYYYYSRVECKRAGAFCSTSLNLFECVWYVAVIGPFQSCPVTVVLKYVLYSAVLCCGVIQQSTHDLYHR